MNILKIKKIVYISALVINFLLIFFIPINANAATTTVSYVGTATDGGGTYPWVNPSNAVGDTTTTSASSTVTVRNNNTNQLILNNFNLAGAGLPVGAQIDGIRVDVERMVSNNRMRDWTVQLTKNGIVGVGNNNANQVNGPTTKTITTYGTVTDLWGTTWTASDLLSSNFGVILNYRNTRNGSRTVDVYRVSVTVDYTVLPKPGGVSSNLSIWLKANKGTSTTTDGAALSTWNDQSGNGYNATAGIAPTYYNSTTNNLNFYPIVNFNGSTQYMENLANGAYSHSYYTVIVPNNTVDGTLSGEVPFGFDCNSGVLNTGTCGLPFSGITLGAFTIAINDEVITHALGASTSWRSAQIGVASYAANKPMLISSNENALSNGTDLFEKGLQIDNYNVNTYQNLSTSDYRLGMSMDGANPFPYNGKIVEIIDFNSRVSDTDRSKIESYLSYKYGITIADGTQNYVASDGTTNMWNTTTGSGYISDIFGIGRDDASEFGQVKSKSVNDDGIITLEAVSEGSNMSPSFVDIADLEFLSISNNNFGNTWTASDAPAGYSNLSRKWKVQEVGEVGTVNLDFDVANPSFDVPLTSTGANYYFTYDSNGNGLLADETPSVMTNMGSNIWRIAGTNIDNNKIFTISTQASSNNIPTNITLSNNNINENVASGTTIGTLTTTDADLLDTHTYSLVAGLGSTDNALFSIVGNTLSILESPDFETQSSYSIRINTDDGNGGNYQKQFTININNLPEAINTIIDFELAGKYTVTSGTWTRTTGNPQEGTYSLESNNGGLPNTQSCFIVNNTFSATGTIDFKYYVSSQLGGDFLRFYIDTVEQQAWSGTVPWTTYTKTDVSAGIHEYKWCYIKDGATNTGTDNAFIDYITFADTTPPSDTTPPDISSINFASGTLLPGGTHNIVINYTDTGAGIDTASANITLNKWNGIAWGSDISASGFNLGSKIITSTSAAYPTNNLTFGKYKYDFSISDFATNSSSTGAVFYIDQPEIIVSSGTLDIGDLNTGVATFSSGELILTVKTVGAGFNLVLNKDSTISDGTAVITDWNGVDGFGYEQSPYTSTVHLVNTNEILATQAGSIDINGNKNTYIYSIKFGALVGPVQVAGNYEGFIRFGLDLNY